MKKKELFICILFFFLTFLTGCAIGLYDNVEGQITNVENAINSNISQHMKYFTINKAMKVDSDFELFSFDEKVPKDVQKKVNKRLDNFMKNSVSFLEGDSNFIYYVVNNDTKKVINNAKLPSKDDSLYYISFSYDKEGDISTSNESSSALLYTLDDIIYDMYGDDAFIAGEDENNFFLEGQEIENSWITLNYPQDMSFTYSIPKEIVSNGGIISYCINSWENYNPFTGIYLMISSALIAIFVLFAPLNIMNEIKPFKTFRSFKGEINLIITIIGISIGWVTVMLCGGYSINGMFYELVHTKLGLRNPMAFVVFVNYLVWMATLLFITIGCYDIKYIFIDGIWRFIKEDTLISVLTVKIKNLFDDIMNIDLKNKLDKNLIKFLALNMLIIIVLTMLWGFGTILSIVYSVALFFMLKKKFKRVKEDYNVLLSSTKELAKGNFDDDMDIDVGIFNSLKEEIKNIEEGFKEAVKEETKSQNMKTELISNVSHDLKTPLTGIKNYVEILSSNEITSQQREVYIGVLNQYIDRLSNLIEDLFEVSKVNSGDIKLDLMPLNIVSLIEQAKSECSEMLEEKNIDIIMSSYDNNIILTLDGNKTYRIFENLFNNISKYAMKNTRGYIDIRDMEDSVKIEIKNISAAQMNFTSEEIVERFVRGDKSRHESGSGLGLAIVKSFVEAQGGSFYIDIDADLFKAIITFKKS